MAHRRPITATPVINIRPLRRALKLPAAYHRQLKWNYSIRTILFDSYTTVKKSNQNQAVSQHITRAQRPTIYLIAAHCREGSTPSTGQEQRLVRHLAIGIENKWLT